MYVNNTGKEQPLVIFKMDVIVALVVDKVHDQKGLNISKKIRNIYLGGAYTD
jgi:hypothetical protein